MKKTYFLILISIIALTSCNPKWSEKNELDINGKVKKVTSYYYKIKKDSIGNIFNDTIKIEVIKLNRKGELVDRITKILRNNRIRDSIFTKFKYNYKGQLIKEIYKMPEKFKDFEVFYNYKNSLLINTNSESSAEEFIIQTNEEYSYHPNGKLSYSEEREIAINSKTKDTVSLQKYFLNYDKDGFLVEIKWTDSDNNLKNSYEKFENDKNGLRLKEKSYNLKDELLDSTIYKYKFDNRSNWIKKEGFKNSVLYDVAERIIE